MALHHHPLVSCVMPTANRRRFVPLSIRYFLSQDYPHKELLILDDGDDPVADLVPATPHIRYVQEPKGRTLGAKRNRLCELAQGDIIAHWDDDDWYASLRISDQIALLQEPNASLCGIECLLYYNLEKNAAYEYCHTGYKRRWLSLLCYRRSLWLRNPFPDIQIGSDTRFLWQIEPSKMTILKNTGLNVCFIHKDNVSPKRISGRQWRSIPVTKIRNILGNDWQFYATSDDSSGILSKGKTAEPATIQGKKETTTPLSDSTVSWIVIIPTYNRPDCLANLLSDLIREKDYGIDLDVRMYDDASTKSYQLVRETAQRHDWHFRRAKHHHGKMFYWQLIDQAFRDLKPGIEPKKLLFVHDDFRLCDHFFEKATRAWGSIKDPEKAALTVFVDEARRHKRCWTGFDPVTVGDVKKIQWVDGAFVAEKKFFDMLNYRVPPVKASRWKENPQLSSGVGRNISVKLSTAGCSLFRTEENLAYHVDGPSVLQFSVRSGQPSNAVVPKENEATSSARVKTHSSPPSRKKWIVVIMTYERPWRLLDLLRDLEEEKLNGVDVEVRVYDDASSSDYAAPKSVIDRNNWHYRCAKKNFGKQRFWQWVSNAYAELKTIAPDTLLVFLQDDVRLCKQFFDRAESEWSAIKDPRKISLNILIDSQREGRPCWTGIMPKRAGRLWRTQWVDQIFVTDRRFLEAINFKVPPISVERWRLNSNLSSGVGQTLSLTLHKLGWHMYCVNESLIIHVESPSVMNGDVRKRENMTSVRFIDGDESLLRKNRPRSVLASLATIPERRAALRKVVQRLLPQVDRLRVYLNNFDEIPEFLEHPKIDFAESAVHGDLGDAGKFFWTAEDRGYLLSCDDDFFYPPDYVSRLLCALEAYNRSAVVGFHGILLKKKVHSYYRDRTLFHFSHGLQHDRSVHIVGSGCAAWHTDNLTLSINDFRIPNMADIWFGRICQRQEIPLTTIARKQNWLRAQPIKDTIYNKFVSNDKIQTRVVNELGSWRTFQMPAKNEKATCN
jgi:glycosyltransferase involved in cell wall biosynthesis